MKKIVVSIQILVLFFVVTSCDGPKKSSENQPVNGQVEAIDTVHRKPHQDGSQGEDRTGAQIIEKSVARLVNRLKLSDTQATNLKDILTKSFNEMSLDMNKTYTGEESKKIGLDLIEKSSDAISNILDENQKEQFKRIANHQ